MRFKHLIIIALALFAVCPCHALTQAEKDQQLKAIDAQIAALQTQRATVFATPIDVAAGSISGVVRDNAGNGLVGITVYNDTNNDHSPQPIEPAVTTDPSGAYAFSGISSGPYKIRAILPDGWTQAKPTTPAGIDPLFYYGLTINLGPDQKLPNQDFVFLPPGTGPPPTSRPVPTGFLKGVTGATTWGAAGNFYKDIGAQLVRPWYSTNKSWTQAPSVAEFKYLAGIQKQYGTQFVVLITPPENGSTVPTPEQAVSVWKQALANARTAGLQVWGWEICNEPDLRPQYFAGTLAQYMDNVLKPVYAYLHSEGERVVGGATVTEASWRSILALGYLNYCDVANHHPYDSNAKGQIARIDRIFPTCNGKPLMLTEWGFHPPTSTTDAQYAAYYRDAYASHKTRLLAVCYFHYKVYNSGGGRAGLLDPSTFKPHEPFYSNYRSLN